MIQLNHAHVISEYEDKRKTTVDNLIFALFFCLFILLFLSNSIHIKGLNLLSKLKVEFRVQIIIERFSLDNWNQDRFWYI
jgi:hypothetical protein